jgi:hypothetical protein
MFCPEMSQGFTCSLFQTAHTQNDGTQDILYLRDGEGEEGKLEIS